MTGEEIRGAAAAHPGRGGFHYLLAAAAAGVMFFWLAGATPLENHEAFVAVTARNMADPDRWLDPELSTVALPPNTALNHWLVPVFNGRPRLEKTPLGYWCEAALLKAGLPLNEFTARLPSAIFGIALALVTLALGRRLMSPRAALLATLMLVTCVGAIQWGRNARPEMALCFWMTAAMLCFSVSIHAHASLSRAALLVLAWGCLGMANLAKEFAPLLLLLPLLVYLGWRQSQSQAAELARPGRRLALYVIFSLLGLALVEAVRAFGVLHWWDRCGIGPDAGMMLTIALFVGAPLAWYFFSTRGWREIPPLLPGSVPGVVLMVALFVPWLWYMTHLFPSAGGLLQSQVVERAATGVSFGSKWPGYYVVMLFFLAAPWSVLFLPYALTTPFVKAFKADRDSLVFLFVWIFGLVLLFSVAAGKRQHYILPAVPPACLLMGWLVDRLIANPGWTPARYARTMLALGIATLAAAIVIAIVGIVTADASSKHEPLAFLAMALPAMAFFIGVILAMRKGRMDLAVRLLMAAMMVGSLGYFSSKLVWKDKSDYVAVANETKSMIAPGEGIVGWGQVDAAMVYYLGRDLPDARGEREPAAKFRLVISYKRYVDELAGLGFTPVDRDLAARAAQGRPLLFRAQADRAVTRP